MPNTIITGVFTVLALALAIVCWNINDMTFMVVNIITVIIGIIVMAGWYYLER